MTFHFARPTTNRNIHFNMPKICNGPQTWNLYKQHASNKMCYNMVQKFMHKILPGSCNGSDEPAGWPPRWPDIIPPNFFRGVRWRTPWSPLSLHRSFHETRNTGQNLLPNNLSIMKSEHMKLDTFLFKLAYTYVHTHTYCKWKKVIKLRQRISLSFLRQQKAIKWNPQIRSNHLTYTRFSY